MGILFKSIRQTTIKTKQQRIEETEREMIIFDNLKSCTIIIDLDYYNQTAMRIKKNMRGNVRHQDKRTIYLTNIISYNPQS